MNNKIFFVNRSEIEGRLDSEYYRPDIAKIEQIIRQKSSKNLADFAYFMASGGTPSVTEESYYSDERNGIPFLRVQNLTEQGILNLDGLKYIAKNVHENMLKRSQFGDQDLLVKITGVGRMAIASVPPIGFLGNTNQHMVVIKTKNRQISEYLANYLNLDIVEKLAKRRSTGGTRPALDYTALRSIPIIENLDFSQWDNVKKQAQTIQAQSQTLLNSISDYLLTELGIEVPSVDNALNNRIFFVNASDVSGGRLDPFNHINYYQEFTKQLTQNPLGYKPLKDFIIDDCAGNWGNDVVDNFDETIFNQCLIIRATELDNKDNLQFNEDKIKFRLLDKKKLSNLKIKENDILIEKSGGSENQPVGRVAILNREILNQYENIAFSNFIHKISVDENKIDPHFLFYYLKMLHNLKYTERMQSQTNGIRNLILRDFFSIPILNVPLQTQKSLVAHINQIRTQAKQLEQQAIDLLHNTQNEIEKMILGGQ